MFPIACHAIAYTPLPKKISTSNERRASRLSEQARSDYIIYSFLCLSFFAHNTPGFCVCLISKSNQSQIKASLIANERMTRHKYQTILKQHSNKIDKRLRNCCYLLWWIASWSFSEQIDRCSQILHCSSQQLNLKISFESDCVCVISPFSVL